jgi:non-ribosomal peptide synthetase component F
LRTRLHGGLTFVEALRRVRTTTLDAYDHQDLPFEKLIEGLSPVRTFSQSLLFQVKFEVQQEPLKLPRLGTLAVETLPFERDIARYDLHLTAVAGDQLEIYALYMQGLFEPRTIAQMLSCYEMVLKAVTADNNIPLRQVDDLLAQLRAKQSTVEEEEAGRASLTMLKNIKRKLVEGSAAQV